MIRENLGKRIIEATKSQDKVVLKVLKLIKTEFQKLQTSRQKGQEMTDAEEFKILQKMIDQRKASIDTYKKAGRLDLAKDEEDEKVVLESFLPASMTDEEIRKAVTEIISNYGEISGMKDLKPIISLVQSEYPMIQSSEISKIFRETLNS